MAMSTRSGVQKLGNSAQQNRKEVSPESSENSDDLYSSAESLPSLDSESEHESEDDIIDNEKAASWWCGLTDVEKNKRKTCIKIHVLSPFLFGIVPPGHEDKLIDWSYECGLLSTKDVQQVVAASNQKFEAIQILENAFEVLIPLMKKRSDISDILRHKNDIIKCTTYKSALLRAEDQNWFVAKRNKIALPTGAKKDIATMALVLTIYHFAGHVQLSYNKKNDVLKQYNEDCKLAEEKALELKEQGNVEFASENYRAAISRYTRAVGLSPFNHIMFGNRAQSFLKVGDYRHALLDAKRAVILKPDWDKGQYRLKQAANAIYNSEGDKESFLTFCVGKELLNKSTLKQNGVVKKENLEIPKETTQRNEEESSEGSVPELVSADESDTSSGESDRETLIKPGMPELLDDDPSDSNESGIDEDSKMTKTVRANKKDSWESSSKRSKKYSKSTFEFLRKQGLTKKETEKECEKSAVEKRQEKEKPKKDKEVNNDEKPLSVPERKTQIEGILREGSKALLDNFFQEASDSYGKALGFIDTGPRKTLDYGDKKYVIVLYAYGTALIGLDLHKELEAAKSTFQNIISSFTTLNFPLAYYGLGRIHYRQNRFPEAIKILEKGLSVISKSCSEICWPGTDIVIEETKEGNLTVSFERILTNCKYPPKPDAVCRFDNCTGVKKSIYCNDTDYKGFVRIICTDACLVEYHIQCWKKLKSEHTDKSTDKDFLDSVCFTSSCFGHVSTIQVYDTDGFKTEVQSDKPKSKKEKTEKNTTTEPTAGTKKKKRSKKKDQEVPNEVEVKQNDVEVHEEKRCDEPDEKPSTAEVLQAEEKEPTKDSSLESQSVEDLNKIPESGMFVLKKDDDDQIALPSKHAKGKNKKKKTKNVQSLDEFLGRDNEHLRLRPFQHDDENYDEIPSEPFTREPPEGWMSDPFSIPPHLQHQAREIESSLATSCHNMYLSEDPWKKDSIREYVYSAFINLLKAEGSLHVMSEPMRKLLNIMPEEARILVQNEGGLRDFLAKSSLFTVEADIVTNFEDKFINDLSTKPQTKGQDLQINILNQNDTGWPDHVPKENSFMYNITPENYGRLGSLLANAGDDLQQNNNSKIDLGLSNFSGLSNYSMSANPENIQNSTTNTGTWSKQGSSLDKWVNVKEFVPMRKDINIVNTSEILNKNSVTTGQNELREIQDESTKSMDNEVNKEATIEDIVNDVSKGITENINKLLTEDDSDVEDGLVKESFDTSYKTTLSSNEVVEVKEHDVKDFVESVEPSKIATVSEEMSLNKENKETVKAEPSVSTLPDQGLPHASRNKNTKTSEQVIEPILNHAANSITKENTVLMEPKVTKEKGVQSKPSTKNKIIMTEAITDPHKAEFEKLLRVNEELKSKNEEWQEKYTKAEKEYNMKLQSYVQKIEVCQRIQKHNEQEKQDFHQEIRKKDEQIKKLQEQLNSVVKSEETQIQALKTEISKMESQYHKEKQQWTLEKESAEKLKSYSQQQSKRASTAEIQLLELQRDVNFSFFTRALQEAELTLHNINQVLLVNSTPQLQELSQKWQRYIADCKLQLGRNKIMFEASIPQIKEGKPLSSLTSLRITRPAAYPGPPILHLPPGSIPTSGNKPIPGPPTIRPELNRGPSPVSGASSQSSQSVLDTTVPGNSDSIQPPVGAQRTTTNPTSSSSVPDRASSEPNLKKCAEQPPKGSNSFEKIMIRLSTLFPNYTRIQMTNFIKEVRASKNGSLTGLSFDDIVACVTKLVKEREKQAALTAGPPGLSSEAGACGFSGPKGPSNSSIPFSRSMSVPAKPVSTTPVIPGSIPFNPAAVSIGKNVTYEDDPCVICHDEMTKATKNVSLDCGHAFHHECIKKWLTGEQSTCPTCRVHALLPDEFPQLK